MPRTLYKSHQHGHYCTLQQGTATSHFPSCSLFLRSSLNLWGEPTHNPFSRKNSSSEKDKMNWWGLFQTQSLLRLCWKDFLYDFSLSFFFFFSKEAEESLGNICFLSESLKFSTESHFSPQRPKHLLHLDAITENENEKDQSPKHSPTQTPMGEREYQLHHFLHYSFSHYVSSVFPSIPLPHFHLLLLPASTSHRKAEPCSESRGFCTDVSLQHKDGLRVALLSLSWVVSSR